MLPHQRAGRRHRRGPRWSQPGTTATDSDQGRRRAHRGHILACAAVAALKPIAPTSPQLVTPSATVHWLGTAPNHRRVEFRDVGGIEIAILRCPNCGGGLEAAPSDGVRCRACQTLFDHRAGVYNLLPTQLDPAKRGEDTVYVDEGEELRKVGGRPWRHILGRHQVLQVIRYDRQIVDMFPEGRFLEIGGGTCFGAAIYKSIHPQSPVYASDVSPSTLRNAAIPASRMFPHAPDVFCAADAERLPFQDESFDAVFAMTMIHHLPEPHRLLQEVRRILRTGGRFVAVDHSVPAHFRWLFDRTAGQRAAEHGIQEALLSFADWRRIVARAGFPRKSLVPYADTTYVPDPLFALAGRLVSRLPAPLRPELVPIGMMIVFDKQ
jgi:SAM-dependent methyltransferase